MLDDNDVIEKAAGQFRLALTGIFIPFELYGHDVFIPSAIGQIMELLRVYTERVVEGIDVPYPHFNGRSEGMYHPDD